MARTGSDNGWRWRRFSAGVWLGPGDAAATTGASAFSDEGDCAGAGDSDATTEGEGLADGEGLGRAFFSEDGDGEALRRLCGVGVG